MADALCGPSNALQNFQKHSTVDRTLQQDRLTARHSPSQGFRSSPGPGAGLLDPEFEAFQAGQLPLAAHPEAQGLSYADFPNIHAPQPMNPAESAAWASDFQRLNIGSPAAQIQQHNYAQGSQQLQLGGGSHDEFAKQQSQPAGPSYSHHVGYYAPLDHLSSMAVMPHSWQPMYSGPVTMDQGQLDQSQFRNTEAFDEAAFARAFDEAAQSELVIERETQRSTELFPEVMMNESAERLLGLDPIMEQERIGADLIHDSREGEKSQKQDDPDALARTAGQLLDSVKDNQSDKFQKSQFLELMRQLRDREVTVEGDKIVGVQSYEEKDELEMSLHSIARQLSQLDFGRVEPLLATGRRCLSLKDNFVIGAFVRTIMQASAALEKLLSAHPDLIQRSKPFGMRIGVEVFALAEQPMLESYPALKDLVLSFKSQFSELGIEPQMVRRRTSIYPSDENRSFASEAELETWLRKWLDDVHGTNQSTVIMPQQQTELLGPDLAMEKQWERTNEILGPHVFQAMSRVFQKARKTGEEGKEYPLLSFEQFGDILNDPHLDRETEEKEKANTTPNKPAPRPENKRTKTKNTDTQRDALPAPE